MFLVSEKTSVRKLFWHPLSCSRHLRIGDIQSCDVWLPFTCCPAADPVAFLFLHVLVSNHRSEFLAKKAVSISVKLHSPCDSGAVKPQSRNFQNCFFSECTEVGQAPVSNEGFFFSVLPFLPCGLERSCLPEQFSWGESLYLCWIFKDKNLINFWKIKTVLQTERLMCKGIYSRKSSSNLRISGISF